MCQKIWCWLMASALNWKKNSIASSNIQMHLACWNMWAEHIRKRAHVCISAPEPVGRGPRSAFLVLYLSGGAVIHLDEWLIGWDQSHRTYVVPTGFPCGQIESQSKCEMSKLWANRITELCLQQTMILWWSKKGMRLCIFGIFLLS